MFTVFVIGVPLMYATLFYKSQRELSVAEEVSLSDLIVGANKREAFERLSLFFKSDVTVGKAPDGKTVAMLRQLYATELADGVDDTPDQLARLETYYKDQEEHWKELGNTHFLSFLFSNYKRRVYWFEWYVGTDDRSPACCALT